MARTQAMQTWYKYMLTKELKNVSHQGKLLAHVASTLILIINLLIHFVSIILLYELIIKAYINF